MVPTLDQKRIEKELSQKKINQVEPSISNNDINNVTKYLASGGWVTEHEVSRKFEKQVANYVDRKFGIVVPRNYCIIFSSSWTWGRAWKKSSCPEYYNDSYNKCNFMDWCQTSNC